MPRNAAYICNICGHESILTDDQRQSCQTCGGSTRMRLMAHGIASGILQSNLPLFQIKDRFNLRGIGLSDWIGYARPLAELCRYRNTFFHKEPKVDICSPPQAEWGKNDFLISSDVFEHTPPPPVTAFQGASKVLKKGGKFLLSVPMSQKSSQTIEHYPRLNRFSVEQRADGEFVVVNTLPSGRIETYVEPRFHGGPGQTLEMRIFSESHVRDLLKTTGFSEPLCLNRDIPEFGLVGLKGVSTVFLAEKL